MQPVIQPSLFPTPTRKREGQSQLQIRPITIRQANEFVAQLHRHRGPVQGAKFALCVRCQRNMIRGVAICGRPVSRQLDDGLTLEVSRVATDCCPNACSCLLGACCRVARAMGYARVISYTLASEKGVSLRAAGFCPIKRVTGQSWSRPSRPRKDKVPIQDKILWERIP